MDPYVTKDPGTLDALAKASPRRRVKAAGFSECGEGILLLLEDGSAAVLTREMFGSIASTYLQIFEKKEQSG